MKKYLLLFLLAACGSEKKFDGSAYTAKEARFRNELSAAQDSLRKYEALEDSGESYDKNAAVIRAGFFRKRTIWLQDSISLISEQRAADSTMVNK